ncbi:ABC-ATPase domain-containing protein [Brevibacterium daeguense]|uniref:ABC-ATPase domain-containing protein n=1 Tax=Brevibacterium daeguense TaxID=909936 RepID=A0ABP8EI55_9MICO|nr:ABC-ATPase domain-containing protein [Brevibacterium daeguense]
MRSSAELERILRGIDGKGYGAYRQLRGSYDLGSCGFGSRDCGSDRGRFRLAIDHVQVDPYAPPSKVRVVLDASTADLPPELTDDPFGRAATSDFLTRRFAEAIRRFEPGPGAPGGPEAPDARASPDARENRRARGTGRESTGRGSTGRGSTGHGSAGRRALSIGTPGQQVLDRTSVLIAEDRVEARFEIGLPAGGRRSADGRVAARLLTEAVPAIVGSSLLHANLDAAALREHVVLLRDQEHLRAQLAGAGLVAFVGDGAILPRRSGDSDLPLGTDAAPFTSPPSLRTSFQLPSGRRVSGMGVPVGVTVIVGGGYHGKSTLLRAIERGVYPHIAGDGREWVITRADATTVRAEDGRAVTGVDISPFISDLPSGTDTRRFTTANASGSTSQAANLVEAIEAGASALLIDEDTSATNFMIRDDRMRALIPGDREPITPFVDRVRPLHEELGVSTVLVAGGSGAFFDVADQVIALDAYRPSDVTAQAHEIAITVPIAASPPSAGHAAASPRDVGPASASPPDTGTAVDSLLGARRVPTAAGLNPPRKTKPARARGDSRIQYGEADIDLRAVAQLVDPAQTEALARALDRLAEAADGQRTIAELVSQLCRHLDEQGLDWLSSFSGHPGHLARPRRQEIHAALNRYRGLEILPNRAP